jgi:hypothetical protein
MTKITQEKFNELVSQKVEEILESDEFEEGFNDWLDETQPEGVNIGNLNYQASTVLKEVDPTAYRCCFTDDYQESERERIEDEVVNELADVYEVLN